MHVIAVPQGRGLITFSTMPPPIMTAKAVSYVTWVGRCRITTDGPILIAGSAGLGQPAKKGRRSSLCTPRMYNELRMENGRMALARGSCFFVA